MDGYHEMIGTSRFCLAPRGVTPWTIHLYVAFLAGCIPVVISDDFRMPFAGIIDYENTVIRWPEENFDGMKLYYFLKEVRKCRRYN